MQIGVLATDHGKHSDEKLAIAVAMDIVNIGATASGQQALDGRKLENKIIEIMEPVFAALAKYEHDEIDDNGTKHLAAGVTGIEAKPDLLAGAVKEVLAAIAASPFASWFSAEQAETYVTKSIQKFMEVGHHMHRDWFARHGKTGNGTALTDHGLHDPDCEHVKAWLASA